jgi:hypothetical protein
MEHDAPPPPPADLPATASPAPQVRERSFIISVRSWLRDYFLGEDPSFGVALVPMCFLSMALFTRHPLKTNFIFDEQEALLANPYVRSIAEPESKIRWIDAFFRDFWGLMPDRSIGSYRPIPDLVWRALWGLGAREQTPFLHHWVNVLLHGVNGALVCVMVCAVTKNRRASWLAGTAFVASAIVTEAVSGVVGIADVLGGLGALLALFALRLPMPAMPFAVFAATLFGMYSKESALCLVPLVPLAAFLAAPATHPDRPLRFARGMLALVASAAAFVFYVEMRRRCFPAPIAHELSVEANAGKPWAQRTFAMLLRWYAQPALPRDPLNNPLIDATGPFRVAGALRVYARGLLQVLFPWSLSGDYSAPQEPIPSRLLFPESVIGLVAFVVPPFVTAYLGLKSWLAWRRGQPWGGARIAIAVALTWVVISYFPVSNIPVVLPTVRAERFWYFPVIGTSVIIALAFDWLMERVKIFGVVLFCAFVGFQCFAARRHANDYTDDLVFWDATRRAVPRSAKAHLNYSVMQGARGHLEIRLDANKTALDLAPQWPMASVYYGDTLCRLHRPYEAWTNYERGFELAPNDVNLIALGVQCLWDEQALGKDSPLREKLEKAGERHPGSWLEYIAKDTLENGEEHKGVDPKYRPRGYNEGPKQE